MSATSQADGPKPPAPPSVGPDDGGRVDGRLQRGARTHHAIIEAYIALISEGEPHPRVEQIAERAGAGTRTVYNRFRDLEGLRAEVWARLWERFGAFAVGDVAAGASLDERLGQVVQARTRFYEAIGPFARAAQGLHDRSAELRRQRAVLIESGKRELRRAFRPELARCSARERPRLVAALYSASSWQAWVSLRDELELDVPEAAAVMTLTLEALLNVNCDHDGEPGHDARPVA